MSEKRTRLVYEPVQLVAVDADGWLGVNPMNGWHKEMANALQAFVAVADLAEKPIKFDELFIEYLPAPHKQPSSLPGGRIAIYAFWWNGVWLKIGQAGPNSAARYTSQHYNPNSSNSNLSKSLLGDPKMHTVSQFDIQNPGKWLRDNSCRVNILIPSQYGKGFLSLLEAFLHLRLQPRYEGYR